MRRTPVTKVPGHEGPLKESSDNLDPSEKLWKAKGHIFPADRCDELAALFVREWLDIAFRFSTGGCLQAV
jgi:hypothetical protein